jgi:hypothetical protein
MTEKPRANDPADPVTASPEEVAATDNDNSATADADLTAKADTTRQATVEPSG